MVAITGATGFVGGALARALAAEGVGIRALARPSSDRGLLANVDVEWVVGDVTDADSLRGAFDDTEWLIHAAGRLGAAGVPEAEYHRLHVGGTRHVLAEAARAGCRRVLYVSSPGVLGPTGKSPVDETADLAPSNPYERSKAAAEQVASQFAANGLPVVIARPEFIYGPGDTHVLGLFRAIQRGVFFYVGRGANLCHPTYIDDAVDGMLRCLRHGQVGEIYHITGPTAVSFRELGRTIARALGARPPWLMIPKPVAYLGAMVLETVGQITGATPPLSRTGVAFFSEDRSFSWQKAWEQLGYVPRFHLQAGVERTVAWYRQEGLLEL